MPNEEEPEKFYLIDMVWWCWNHAENIGFPHVEKERPRKEEEECYGCKNEYH